MVPIAIVFLAFSFLLAESFRVIRPSSILRAYSNKATWQEDLDKILDVDTSCESRRTLTSAFLKRLREVSEDVRQAIQDKNVEKIAPKNLQYGKAVQGLRKFQNQVLTDVIPEILTKTVPKLVDEGPKIINQLVEKGPATILEQGQKTIERVREISQDPSALQATVDDLRNELKNVVKSTPIGLETPSYEVLKKTDEFEIRQYARYSVVTTRYTSDDSSTVSYLDGSNIPVDSFAGATSFQRLAGYLFGENSLNGKPQSLKMTMPVIMDNQSMSFILPNGLDSTNAPIPDSEQIDFNDVANEIVAVREFTGLVTEGEVKRQKARLEEYLLAEGIVYDSQSFKVLQYNPPYTVPWIRRNEIICKVTYHTSAVPQSSSHSVSTDQGVDVDRTVSEDTAKFFASPEAGD
mmetsp:Transcript_7999/g.8765  ORF Transcript_7999/g.8765 Transcript_7999/m.8765 type:complete len:406 (-) Transcript_7999:3376-4593(-)|eukprot:gene5596-6014_t